MFKVGKLSCGKSIQYAASSAIFAAALALAGPATAWEPSKPVEFVVPAGLQPNSPR